MVGTKGKRNHLQLLSTEFMTTRRTRMPEASEADVLGRLL